MAIPGFVYALINPSMPNLVKVGRTARSPVDRASELSGVTGVPTPFVVVYHQFFLDSEAAEAYVHQMLSLSGHRVSEVREFFKADITAVINMIAQCPGKGAPDDIDGIEDRPGTGIGNPADLLFEKACNLENGLEGEFQDYREAYDAYCKAEKLGSVDATLMIGNMILEGRGVAKDTDAAIALFKKATSKGNNSGYIGLARAYMIKGHEGNFDKAWKALFEKYSSMVSANNINDGHISTSYNYFYYYALSGWKPPFGDVPLFLHQIRDEILSYSLHLVEGGTGPGEAVSRRAHRFVLRALFPEDESGENFLTYDDVFTDFGFIKASYGSIHKHYRHAGLTVQLISGGWALDIGPRQISSGKYPGELERHLNLFFNSL